MNPEKPNLLRSKPMFHKRTYALAMIVLFLVPALITAPYILSDTENPEGEVQYLFTNNGTSFDGLRPVLGLS